MNPGISPIAFYIGPIPVHWYGIIFAVIIIVGAVLAAHEARRRGEEGAQVACRDVFGVVTPCLFKKRRKARRGVL